MSVLTTIDRGSTGSRGSFDPPLLEVGGQAMLFDPPLALVIFCFLALDRRPCPVSTKKRRNDGTDKGSVYAGSQLFACSVVIFTMEQTCTWGRRALCSRVDSQTAN